jgi:hypothetical protein
MKLKYDGFDRDEDIVEFTEYPHYDGPKIGIYKGNDKWACLKLGRRFQCTLEKGHQGPHAAHAHSSDTPLATWKDKDLAYYVRRAIESDKEESV